MEWWLWIPLGLGLLGLEILTGGFYLLFFGLSALIVGALVSFDVLQPIWLQWVLFSVLSVLSLLIFRGPLLARIKSGEGVQDTEDTVDSFIGAVAIPMENLSPGGTGKAELRGTPWTVRNSGQIALAKGQRSRVVKVEGLTLWIAAE